MEAVLAGAEAETIEALAQRARAGQGELAGVVGLAGAGEFVIAEGETQGGAGDDRDLA